YDSGNWENGKNILYRLESDDVFASKKSPSTIQVLESLADSRRKLSAAREKRVRPTRDEKVLTAWNGLMISGYVDAYQATGDKDFLKAALDCANFLETNMLAPDGHVWRSFMDGHATIDAFLEDYALMASAYINLYHVTFDIHWLTLARRVTD